MSAHPISVRVSGELYDFLREIQGDESLGYTIKRLMIEGAKAQYGVELPEPRRPGGLTVDLEDPEVMARLREQAAKMREVKQAKADEPAG